MLLPSAEKSLLVTVGLPVYNGQRFIAGALDALLAQTYTNFELIISDNASTDGTADICNDYARRDKRVRYYRNARNIGLSPNFNRVFRLASTKYFKWSTADDWVGPEMLADAVAVLESDPSIVLAYPKTTLIDETTGVQQRYEDGLNLLQDDPVERFVTFLKNVRLSHHHQGLIRSDAVARTAMLRDHVASDINFLAELTLYGKFAEIPKYQFFRRFHPDSSSWNRGSAAHQARRYHAAGSRRKRVQVLKKQLAFTTAILRSPCTFGQKRRLLTLAGKRMYWDKAELGADLAAVLTQAPRAKT